MRTDRQTQTVKNKGPWFFQQTITTVFVSRLIDKFCSLVHHALTTNLLGEVEYPTIDYQDVPYLPPANYPNCCSMPLDKGWEDLRTCDFSSKKCLPKNCILERILWMQKLQEYDANTIHRIM